MGNMEHSASRDELDSTQYHEWYKILREFSLKSEFVPLSEEFLNFLKQDGIILPAHVNPISTELSDDDEDSEIGRVDADDSSTAPTFPDFDVAVGSALKRLGGEVAIKTNWSSPIDVTWMTLGSLKATSLRDIYLQLKSSDRVIFDLENMYDLCGDNGPKTPVQPTLVLRKWANLLPNMEFRVFVKSNGIVGICQRDCCTYYPFLASVIGEISEKICNFFDAHMFTKDLPNNYCMDVYVDKKERIWIIDVNCFGLPSSSLLFEWDELLASSTCLVKFVENENQKLQSALGIKRGPIDVHLAPDFSRFMEICQQQQLEPDSSDDEEENET